MKTLSALLLLVNIGAWLYIVLTALGPMWLQLWALVYLMVSGVGLLTGIGYLAGRERSEEEPDARKRASS